MLVFAHPDDEIIAAGGRLERFRDAMFVCVTDGAPRDGHDVARAGFDAPAGYAAARRQERRAAFALASMLETDVRELGIEDQRAAYRLGEIVHALSSLMDSFPPVAVITHPYEGGHPDHDATAFAVARACAAQRSKPLRIEAAFYHMGPQGIETGSLLPPHRHLVTRVLTAPEAERKAAMLRCFTTQQETLQYFRTDYEMYRIAPDYDFTQPPHESPLFYEKFDWGISAERFRQLTAALGAHP